MAGLRRVVSAVVATVAVAAGGVVASHGFAAAAKRNPDSAVGPAASTGYFNTYTTVATLGNANGCDADEGFAVGSSYTYAVKINGDETEAVIYRTTMSDGTTTLMKNGDDGTTYATYLGHANDVVLSSTDGNYYMFIVTMKAGSTSLVKLKYVGTTYYKVGSYTIEYDGANHSMSGVKITSKDASTINFLFKSGRTFYRGSLPLDATSGTINLTYGFYLDTEDALVNGSKVANITSYVTQGFGYHSDTVYFPLTYNNVSIVLVYRNISTASGTINAASDLSFRITSSAYPTLFEIESVGIGAGSNLWFNTNRKTSSSDTAHDGVHYFNGYTA